MTWNDFLRKLASRKFWAAIAGVVISLLFAFGMPGEQSDRIVGCIGAVGTLAIYMLAEGNADASGGSKGGE